MTNARHPELKRFASETGTLVEMNGKHEMQEIDRTRQIPADRHSDENRQQGIDRHLPGCAYFQTPTIFHTRSR